MSIPVILSTASQFDLDEAALYLSRNSPKAGFRFLNAARATFDLIAQSPEIGVLVEPVTPRLAGLRRFAVRKFRDYLIFYTPSDDSIEIIRILHGARNIRAILERE